MLTTTGLAGVVAMTARTAGAVPQTSPRKTRIACLISYWGATRSHADWIVTKLIDGYWWKGAHTPSRVEVAAVYLDQKETSGLGRKVCASKGIPIFDTVAGALTLGGKDLAVDGVVIVGEHGDYRTSLKGQWLLPRWWMYQQAIKVFAQSGRAVPVFNDKHLSYDWDEAKWMFDKSRELKFALTGGSSIPVYYREPEIELDVETPIRASVVVGGAPDEGGRFHCIDVLQSFVERRRGGETGVAAVQTIHGPETWAWTARNPWASTLLEAIRTRLKLAPGHFQAIKSPNACIVEYRDGTQAAVYNAREAWTYAGDIAGRDPVVVQMPGFPGPFDQYHASNELPHWIVETMVTKKEPFEAERLLLSTGILAASVDSPWENGRFLPIGRRLETPFLDMTYTSTRGPQFNTGPRPPAQPYLRGFSS